MLSMALQIVGRECPTSLEKPLFHPSHILLVLEPPSMVMLCTFHMDGGNVGGLRRIRKGGKVTSGRCGG